MSNRLFNTGARTALLLGSVAVLCLSGSALARDRGVKVAPDLADEWILQLSPGSGVIPGYTKPNLANPNGILDRRQVSAGVVVEGGGYRERGAYQERDGWQVRGSRDIKDEPREAGRPYHDRRATDPGITGSVAAASPAGKGRAMKRADAIDPVYLPQQVAYASDKPAGTVVIDTEQKFLYLVEEGGTARRYGVGVGKPGFEWAGSHTVTQKREWPTWTPPAQMRAREKKKGKILPVQMKGGPQNPLGARAMYLGSTLYRIHGTNQPWSIGKAVSSGCIRMRNEDVTDLYARVPVGTKVIVL